MLSHLIRPLRDHRCNPMPTQPATDAGIAVSLVAGDTLGASTSADPHGVHDLFELRRFVPLAGGDFCGKGQASAVSN